jgi:hypothetical protein
MKSRRARVVPLPTRRKRRAPLFVREDHPDAPVLVRRPSGLYEVRSSKPVVGNVMVYEGRDATFTYRDDLGQEHTVRIRGAWELTFEESRCPPTP